MPDVNTYNYQQTHDRKLAASICVAANVQVLAFDPVKMMVNVQPLSKQLENGRYESQPPILRVPVACTRCGGFIFRPWFNAGDTGTVVYLDHDIDSTVTGGKEAAPSTERNHSESDAVFIGAIVSGSYEAQGLPAQSLALATEDGGIYIAVTQEKVALKNGGTTADFTANAINMNTQEVTINASGTITIQGATVNIN
jgi:hypothetical protein